MPRRTTILVVLTGLFALLLLAGPTIAADGSVSIKESDERYAFSPGTVYVNVGDTVTWTNQSDAPHNVTSDSGDELASENFNEDETFDHAFNATGTFAYHCTIHAYMTGSVVVLAEGVTAPPTDAASSRQAPTGSAPGLLPALVVLAGLSAGVLGAHRRLASEAADDA
jgi:plastocyanin